MIAFLLDLTNCSMINASNMFQSNPGQSKLAPTREHHEGWMISDQGTVFCWLTMILVLTIVVSSVAVFFTAYLLTTQLRVVSR